MLYICATPIGNLDDVSYRLIATLKDVDLICAEDTRRIHKLLARHEILGKKIDSYNDHNKERKTGYIVSLLEQGKNVALVSDSGTPCISDPGFNLVRAAAEKGIQVSPIPGPSAAVAALSVSGLATDIFTFYGFLKKKESRRNELIQQVKDRNETSVFYESQYRICKTMDFFAQHIPGSPCVVCRELTKKFEEMIRGTVQEVAGKVKGKKGEFVIIIGKR